MRVNSGELNKKIAIIEKKPVKDRDGYDAQQAETVIHTCWAKFTRTSGKETVKANADLGEVKCRFLIRFTKKPIDRKMSIRYAGSDYEIQFINDYEDSHAYIEIWCRRLTPEGNV